MCGCVRRIASSRVAFSVDDERRRVPRFVLAVRGGFIRNDDDDARERIVMNDNSPLWCYANDDGLFDARVRVETLTVCARARTM